MANFSRTINFNESGAGDAAYSITVNAVTTRVTGGTQIAFSASSSRIRFDAAITPAFSSSGTRNFSIPFGRSGSVGGNYARNATESSVSTTWSYDFRSSNTQSIWGSFNRFVSDADAAAQGYAITVSATAAGSGSSYLLSTTVSLAITLEQPPAPAITAPTILEATTTRTDGVNLTWSGQTGTITNYGIWWNTTPQGNPSSTSTPDFTATSSPFLDTGISSGSTRYYWIRSQGATNSAWFPAGNGILGTRAAPPPTEYTYTISYNANGGTGSMSSTSTTTTNTSASLTIAANGFSRSGFNFSGWNTMSDGSGTPYSSGSSVSLTSSSPSITLFAQWSAALPVFTDTTITTTGILGRNISLNADRTVAASPVSSYSIVYSGSGSNPTSWLTINSSGELSGVPPAVGVYTFSVRANNGGSNNTDSPVLSISVRPAGKRFNGVGYSDFSLARRFDGSTWIDLTIMRKWNGSSWENITN